MRTLCTAIIALLLLIAAGAYPFAATLFRDDCVEVSRENVYSHSDFTREVFAGCPIEKAELNRDTNVLTVFFPREEYRDLLRRLEQQGWAEQGEQSGRYSLGTDNIVVERGALIILSGSLASR